MKLTDFQGTLMQAEGASSSSASGAGESSVFSPRQPTMLQEWTQAIFSGTSIPPWAQSILLLVGTVVLAVVLDWVVTRVLRRLTGHTRLKIDDEIVRRLHAPLIRSAAVIGIAAAAQPMDLEAVWNAQLHSLLLTLAVLIWGPFVFKAASLLLSAASNDREHFSAIEPRTFPLFDNLVKVLLFGAFFYLILVNVWGVHPGAFVASAGIAGIAIGFAAQDTLSNLFAGVLIIADAPYGVGDYITLDSGERGEVLHIGLRSTRILTRDDIEITIPNSVMSQAKITNEAGGPSPKHRIRVPISCAYGSDVDQVRSVLLEIAKAEPRIVEVPEPRVRFRSFDDSGLFFELLGWIPQPVLRGQTLDSLNTAVYKRFAEEGIEIPYPKRDVYLHPTEAGVED